MAKFILILVWQTYGNNVVTSTSVEFDNKPACLAAAAEIRRQEKQAPASVISVLFCASKG